MEMELGVIFTRCRMGGREKECQAPVELLTIGGVSQRRKTQDARIGDAARDVSEKLLHGLPGKADHRNSGATGAGAKREDRIHGSGRAPRLKNDQNDIADVREQATLGNPRKVVRAGSWP
ncbi:hypothetical protein SS37A_02100 [Methylocystis iwaonis]|uniref:Uncharacterized protein n=1 Tax=Methylocystis iwaonis TaxID=2885079 RepID=A0ABM8E463_9HYPH|nr:hypothetical protein SS37A_02100 [Methylocystis iwaonis]